MTLLTIDNVSQVFDGHDIFSRASATLYRGNRVGLVGPNGVGKTSLLRLIAGTAEPHQGAVHLLQGVRVGYLHQEAMQAFADEHSSLLEAMLQVFANVQNMEQRLRQMEHDMAHDSSLLEAYGDLLEQYEAAGGYDFTNRIEQILTGLGFEQADYDTPISILSGGQKTRALLARLLLEAPDLLILDEPTNHLDVEAIRWLETMLRQWQGTLLIVSHDRYFLDIVVETIWDLSRDGIEAYRGNYSAYLKQREERRELAAKTFAQEKLRFEQEIDYIKRNIARASTSDNAAGRLRRLSRELIAIEEVGLMAYMQRKSWLDLGVGSVRPMKVPEVEKAIRELQDPVSKQPRLNMAMRTPSISSSIVLRTEALHIGYPGRTLFTSDDLMLLAGECVAVIGGNGAGKTTFLRTLRGEIAPLSGKVQQGKNVQLGYFAQAHHTLVAQNSVLDELLRHKTMSTSTARGLLARYLFREDDVFKPVGALSGGERAKLALAILALEGANVLVLDEPTNHLDIPAQEALQEVLETFDGTILMVTHDRYLVDRLATQIWSVTDGYMNVFHGPYREYLVAERRFA
jgi:ATP-binding cassette, subfamily F, member 3